MKRVNVRRVLATLLVISGIGSGLYFGRSADSPDATVAAPSATGASTRAASSSWYCPMTFATASDPGASGVVITNFEEASIGVTASVFPSAPNAVPVEAPLTIAGNTRTVFNPGEVVDSQFASVLVQVDGGGVAVERFVRDANGESTSPCATQAASTWYTADGSTDQADLRVALFNPFADEAIVNIAANSEVGLSEPEEYRGLVVPARSSVVVNISEQLRRRSWIQLSVSVRVGRIVVDQLQTGTLRGAPGLSLSLATPTTSTDTVLPVGLVAQGVTDRITLFNPGVDEVEARLTFLPEGDFEAITSSLFIPGGQRVARDLEREVSIPRDVPLIARVETDEPGLVVARTSTAIAPSLATGFNIAQGPTPNSQMRWALPSVDTTDPRAVMVAFFNPADSDVVVRTTVVGNGVRSPGPEVTVPARRDAYLRLDAVGLNESQSVLFEAAGLVSISRQVLNTLGATTSSAMAIPLR